MCSKQSFSTCLSSGEDHHDQDENNNNNTLPKPSRISWSAWGAAAYKAEGGK